MSGWQTLYPVFPDEATARAFALQLGAELPEDSVSAGSANYAFTAYTQWNRWPGTDGPEDPGEAAAGYWVLARFNTDRPAGLAAYNAVVATGLCQEPVAPSNVWAGQ